MRLRLATLGAGLLLVSADGFAQTLADVAQKEKDRREALAGTQAEEAKVYTNEDLSGAGRLTTGSSAPASAAATAPEAPETTDPDIAAGAGAAPDEASGAARDETWWRTRITDAREALQRNELLAAALQNRVDGLWAQFTATDNPLQRRQVELDRETAMAEQAELTLEIERLRQEIATIEEEARRERVPPGWLR